MLPTIGRDRQIANLDVYTWKTGRRKTKSRDKEETGQNKERKRSKYNRAMKRYMDPDMKDFNNGFLAFRVSFTFSPSLSLNLCVLLNVCVCAILQNP